MAMEALCSSNDLFNFVIYDTISAAPRRSFENDVASLETTVTTTTTTASPNDNMFMNHDDHILLFDHHHHQAFLGGGDTVAIATSHEDGEPLRRSNVGSSKLGVVGPTGGGGVNDSSSGGNTNKKKKRRRKARVCKNKEEAENQRMTHIAVERNRRKQMNEHLAVLRSLMPDSYVQRGDQASIVGGAIEFVKELEHLLQSLEVKKLEKNLQAISNNNNNNNDTIGGISKVHDDQENGMEMTMSSKLSPPPFSQFFVYPQYTWSQQTSSKYTSKTKAAMADIEVTLIETHASIRILSRRSLRQLSKLVAGFDNLHLTVLHLNVTTMDPLVLYSVSVKVEEECLLTSVDDIASAINHMLRIIDEEAALC